MKFSKKQPPRKYKVGLQKQITIKDCGKIQLDHDEQVSFISNDGKEYDVTRKKWGYYATPSMNGRLKRFGYKTALVKNSLDQYYIMIVNKKEMDAFKEYLNEERQIVVEWIDER